MGYHYYFILACLKIGYALSFYPPLFYVVSTSDVLLVLIYTNNSVVCVVFNQDVKVHQWLRHKMMFFVFNKLLTNTCITNTYIHNIIKQLHLHQCLLIQITHILFTFIFIFIIHS